MSKLNLQEKALKILAENEDKKEVFCTEDGEAFFNRSDAKSHAKGKLKIHVFTQTDNESEEGEASEEVAVFKSKVAELENNNKVLEEENTALTSEVTTQQETIDALAERLEALETELEAKSIDSEAKVEEVEVKAVTPKKASKK